MSRTAAVLGSIVFLTLVLGLVVVFCPYIFCYWRIAPPFFGFFPFRIIGVLMIILGLTMLLDCYVHFAMRGLGTPAPVAPPPRLVVTGLYRYVRNPMYVAIVTAVWGEGLFFGNWQVMRYGLYLWVGFFAFVVFWEERRLRRRFGQQYLDFCARVPRWIPRFKPLSSDH